MIICQKMNTIFKEQKDEKFKKKDTFGQIPLNFASHRTVLQEDQRENSLLWNRKKQALERYLAQATYLHGAQSLIQKASNGKMTLKQLCDLYLQYQHSRVLAGNLTPKHYNDQIGSLHRLMSFLGQGCKIESISTLDLQNYKRKLQSSYASVDRQNLHISVMKSMFHWARRNDVLETIPNIDAISKGKVVHKEMYTFDSQQIRKLLSAADIKMKAMIWLGLNCGFGCTDCGKLKWKDLDFENSRV